MSRSSNSEGCKGPPSAASALIAGARSAVIQSKPAGARSASMRAFVIMPRSADEHDALQPEARA